MATRLHTEETGVALLVENSDTPSLADAQSAVSIAQGVVDQAIATAKSIGPAVHEDQVFLYDLSHAAAGVSMCAIALRYGEHGETEQHLANIFIGRVVSDLAAKLWTNHERWGVAPDAMSPALSLIHI